MPIALTVLLFVIAAALVGGAFVAGTPVFGVVIALFVLAAWGAVAVLRRTTGRAPLDDDDEIEFTERDRETLLPTPDAGEKAALRSRAAERERR
jgi:hypothetical protein